ncbi:NRDE-2, necessary for RNA interference-domain-containing protein [Xylariaceae sp. FL0016]|nr:NRDE-2, necessary for RNA interference-domain-containing protein [Xylariaceae sp. FL0016]
MTSHKEGKASSVPKFSSFKPNTNPEIPIAKVGTGDELGRAGHDNHRTAKESHLPARHRRHPSKRAQPNQSTSQPRVSHSPDRRDLTATALYLVDKRGDSLIKRYGTNDRRDVPAYRRIGAGRILGVNGFMRVEKSGNREEFILGNSLPKPHLLSLDRKALSAKGVRLKSQALRLRRDELRTDSESPDFLPFKDPKKRKRDDVSSEDSNDENPVHKSIYGKSKKHEHSDSDDSVDEISQDLDPLGSRTIELSRLAREHPDDLKIWSDLVDHQDRLLERLCGGRGPTAAEIKSFADIKLSILEQAISHAKDPTQSEALHLRIIREGVHIWEPRAAEKRWQDILSKYPRSFEIWRAYLNYRQTTLSSLQYDEVKQLHIDRLKHLARDITESPSTLDLVPHCEQMIYVFLRLTRFISDSGFAELATAAWQAALELNFARPPILSPQGEHKELSSSFHDFWESEVPRLGEETAQGWAAFESEDDAQEPPEPKASEAPTKPCTRDGYKAWSIAEQERDASAAIPARTLDDGAEDDPFRVIMYADLEDLLLFLPSIIISEVQYQLVDAFLIFCGMPPAFASRNIVDAMQRDGFLGRSTAGMISEQLSKDDEPFLTMNSRSQRSPEFSHSFQTMSMSMETLIPSTRWFKYLRKCRDDLPIDQQNWILTALKQLTRTFGVKKLSTYYLACETLNNPGTEKKSAKALLKQDPSNIDLYLGYAILEWERSDQVAARNVLSAALTLPGISRHDRHRLIISATWIELASGDLMEGTLQLCSLGQDEIRAQTLAEPTGVSASLPQVLKVQQSLASTRDYLLSTGDLANAIVYAEGLALLMYLTQRQGDKPSSRSQGDIESAMTSISECSAELASHGHAKSTEHEKLLQSAARLLYYHASHGPFQPAFLREQLARYIKFFPQNTIFLSLFAWREERLSINDRVRSLLDLAVLNQPDARLSSFTFAIQHEMDTGNAHSTRAAFEHALAGTNTGARDECKHNPDLWISYIRFCYSRKELRAKAKDVFYRAIQACPWSKDVFMEAFGTLGRDMDSSELRSVYRTMCEKGFRIHVEMEDFVEGWRKEMKGNRKDRVINKSRA